MEGVPREIGDGDSGDETEVLVGLSTVLVATIQEVKDRISHIEFLFCSQLFPRVRSRARDLQRRISSGVSRDTAMEGWRRKEVSLMRQIEQLRFQKEQAEEETRRAIGSLERERAETEQRHAAEMARILEKLETDGRTSEMAVADLRDQVRIRSDEVHQCKQLLEKLMRQVKDLLYQKEKAEEETRRAVNSLKRELTDKEEENGGEKARILEKLESAEKTKEILIAELRDQVRSKSDEVRQLKQLQETLLRQLDQKDLALTEERSRRKQLASNWVKLEERYKQLKSQYSFLLRKAGLTSEAGARADDGLASPISLPHKRKCPQDRNVSDPVAPLVSVKAEELTDEVAGGAAIVGDSTASHNTVEKRHLRSWNSPSPTSSKPGRASAQSSTVRSPWVDTRGRQLPGEADPHDDFLDTPMDAIRARTRRTAGDESDGDVKEVDAAATAASPRARAPTNDPESGRGGGFKYVDSVRKKAERENLKGMECKQCKKFYDAVLPGERSDGGGKNPGELRCEHHEGVSRHRYRHAPPMTPEGFWNIGFDSEV